MDLSYKLIVDMEARGSLQPHLEKVGKSGGDLSKVKDVLGTIGSGIASLGSSMAGAFTGAVESAANVAASVAKIGAVGAVAAVGFGVKLNSELEQAQVSLAAIFNSTGQSNGMLKGMQDAQAVMKDMRKDAADLPGEFKDLMGIFRMAATPGFQAGGSVKDIEKLSANAMAFAASRGIEMGQAGRELGMLLQGRAGAHNVFGTLLGITGDKVQKFNDHAQTSPNERLKMVEKELKKEESSREFFGSTFDAQSSTLVDNAKKFLGAATSGVFDRVKGALETTNAWFDRNETKIIGFAEKVGDKLSYAFEFGRRKIEEWTPAMLAFVENAYSRVSGIWERVAPMIEKAGEVLKKALTDPKTFDRIEGVLKMYALVKIGGIAAPMAGSMMSSASGMFSAGGGAAGALGGVAAAGAVGAALVVLGTTVYGVVDILTDSSNAYHDYATKQAQQIGEHTQHINDAIGPGGLSGAFKSVADFMGAAGLTLVNNWMLTLDTLATATGFITGVFNDAGDKIAKILGVARLHNDHDPADASGRNDQVLDFNTISIKTLGGDGGLADAQKKKESKGVAGGGGTSIQKVEIVVSSNQDPSRIARSVIDEIQGLNRNPTSSRYVRNWGSVRP